MFYETAFLHKLNLNLNKAEYIYFICFKFENGDFTNIRLFSHIMHKDIFVITLNMIEFINDKTTDDLGCFMSL